MSSILETYKSDLHPAIAPERVPFEMVTIGWYLAFGMCLLIFIVFVVFLFRRWLKKKYQREANKILISDIRPLVLSPNQRQKGLGQLSGLLKQVAMKSYSREKVSELYGEPWIEFLNSTCRSVDFYKLQSVNLIDSQYQPNEKLAHIERSELEKLIRFSQKWIGGHSV
jgi:cbb3-type cytochrome oxidase subunit 3